MNKIIISLICCLLPGFVMADTLKLREDAPDRHIVVKGDTLWDISAKFFNDPWKWPQIWGLNKDVVTDPHWIFPGEVIFLDRTNNTLHVARPINPADSVTQPAEFTEDRSGITKLSPQIRVTRSPHDAIPSIPAAAIAPFLSRPILIEEDGLSKAPAIVGTYEQRVILGNNDIAYVRGLPAEKGAQWQIYRPGKALRDPESDEVLGYEANYLGDANVEQFADISTLRITKAIREIQKGDRLTYTSGETVSHYLPRAPENKIDARVISIYDGISQASQYSIITLNKGQRDGLENGHVLALYRKGEVLDERGGDITLPDVRYGLLFVFRTFDKVAYALVMQTRLPVKMLDSARTP